MPKVLANSPINKEFKLPDAFVSQENCIVDLGEDEFTQGRLHPMMDNELRIRRLYEEARDPEVAVIMLDVVIGYGSHPDPASEIAPAIAKCIAEAKKDGTAPRGGLRACGTDEDPAEPGSPDRPAESCRCHGGYQTMKSSAAMLAAPCVPWRNEASQMM